MILTNINIKFLICIKRMANSLFFIKMTYQSLIYIKKAYFKVWQVCLYFIGSTKFKIKIKFLCNIFLYTLYNNSMMKNNSYILNRIKSIQSFLKINNEFKKKEFTKLRQTQKFYFESVQSKRLGL